MSRYLCLALYIYLYPFHLHLYPYLSISFYIDIILNLSWFIYTGLYLPISISIYLDRSVSFLIRHSFFLRFVSIFLSFCQDVCLSTHLPSCPCIYVLSVSLSASLCICIVLNVCLSTLNPLALSTYCFVGEGECGNKKYIFTYHLNFLETIIVCL